MHKCLNLGKLQLESRCFQKIMDNEGNKAYGGD